MKPIKKRNRGKNFFIFLGSVFSLLLFLTACLPWFLSTQTGKQYLISSLEDKLSAEIQIKHLSLSWKGPQTIVGLQLEKTNGELKINCPKISCESSLLTLLFPSHDVGLVSIQSPEIEIRPNFPEKMPEKPRVQAASFFAEIPIQSTLPLFSIPFIGNIEIDQAKISLFSENEPPIFFDLSKCHLFANSALSNLSSHIEGSTLQDNIEGKILINSAFNQTNSQNHSLSSQISLKNFPIKGIDQILALKFPQYQNILKEGIGPSLDLEGSASIKSDQFKVSLDVKSEQFQTSINMELKDGQVQLLSPASLKLSLKDSFLKSLEKNIPFLSKNPLSISLTVNRLLIPKTDEGLFIEKTQFDGAFEIQSRLLSDISIQSKGVFSSSNLMDEALLNLSTVIRKQSDSSVSELRLSCKDLFKKPFISSSLEMAKTSSTLLENLFQTDSLNSFFGAFVQADLTAEGLLEELNLTLSLSSPMLKVEKANLLFQDNQVSLKDPLPVRWILSPSSLTHFFKKKTSLQKSCEISGLISSLSLDPLSLENLQIDANFSASSLAFTELFSLKNYQINNIDCKVIANSLSNLSLHLVSDLLHLQVLGGLNLSKREFFWTHPIQIEYNLSNEELSAFFPQKKRAFLSEKTKLKFSINPSKVLFDSLESSHITSHVGIHEITLVNEAKTSSIKLQNTNLELDFLGSKDLLNFSLSSDVLSGKFICKGTVMDVKSQEPSIKAHLSLSQFPVAFLDTITTSSWTSFLGPALDLKLGIDKNKKMQVLDIEAKSAFFNMSGGIALDDKNLFLTSPMEMGFILTSNAYTEIAKRTQSPFVLAKDSSFKASFSKLHIPLLPNQMPDLFHVAINGKIQNEEISFHSKNSRSLLTLINTAFSLQKKDEKTPLSLSLDTQTNSSQKGSLHLEAQFKKILSEKGEFTIQDIASDLVATFQRFPSEVLEIWFQSKHREFSDLLGPVFDMTCKASLDQGTGPVALNLTSQNVKCALEGNLSSGVLTLYQNFIAQVALTPQTSKVFLKELNPLGIHSLHSSTPLTLEISSSGFSMPLSPFSPNAIQISKGRIRLDKVYCSNEGNINLMLGLLKAKQMGQSKELELWFTPLDFQIRQGVLDIERTEVLVAGTYDIALWGTVNLPKDRVNMNLGLTASCLNEAFGIRDLPSDYVLHIPLTGTLSHVDLNKKVATSKLVALTLWQSQSVAGSAAGGVGGALIGGLLNQVLTPPGNDGPTPRAKTPFPWDKRP